MSLCWCGSGKTANHCCSPYLSDEHKPETPEQLMRSRYSAYCCQDYQYILRTYSREKQSSLSVALLEESAQDSRWIGLRILSIPSPRQVEFVAYYIDGKQFYQMHETSNFVQEAGHWRYVDGTLHEDCGKVSIKRNDSCFCGSGKKHKQCCLTKLR